MEIGVNLRVGALLGYLTDGEEVSESSLQTTLSAEQFTQDDRK